MGGTQNSSSRSWEEDIYWTHFQFIRFTQFLQPTHLEQQLALPKTFSDNLKNKLPANVTLKGPSGVVWDIGLTTRDDTIYSTDGWQQFVKDHSLKQNDFLVFKYNGESLFEVLIFHGESFCEKAASYFILERGQAHTGQRGRKAKDTNTSVEEVNTPSNGSVECGLPEKSWEEDIYWTHFQFIHFTQFLRTDFEQQLALPKTFSDNLKKKLPENVTLKGPSGVVWNIGLTTRDDIVYFVDGWKRFIKDHSLKQNDFLVFKYNGKSLFEVLIFDGDSFCEKAASYFVGKCGNAQTEQGGRKAKDTNKSVSPEQFLADAVPSHTNGKRTKKRPVNEVTPLQTKRGRRPKAEAALSKLSSSHAEKKIAESFTSSFPYFVKMIKTFNVDGPRILNVPHQFSKAHLPNRKIKIILHNLKGEQWTVNSVPTTRVHTSHTLCGGWMAFVRGNSIKVGDVCIFELIRECELRVRIAEVGKDGLDCQVGKLACSMLSERHDVASHNTSRYMPKKPKVSSKCRTKVDLSDKKLSKIGQEPVLAIEFKKSGRASTTSKKMGLSPKSKASHKKTAVPRKHRVEDELSSQAKAGLRMLFALDEQRVAEAFTSPFPNFVKIMKKFNVSGSYTLKIPYQFSAAHLPAYKTEVTLRNSRGQCWIVNSVPDAKGRTIHTFCGGWIAFVRDNDINFGDTCIFELVSHYVMQVHISGVGKEGLDHQIGHAKLNNM